MTETKGKMSDHALETYKSLIQISVEDLKFLALLNGGAAVALLAFLGNVVGKGVRVPGMQPPMACFLGGLVLCGFAFVGSYVTQLVLYNESIGEARDGSHKRWLWTSLTLGVASIVAFGAGSLVAVAYFSVLSKA